MKIQSNLRKLFGAAVIIVLSLPATAQTTNGAAATTDTAPVALEEIVVTAQKRSQDMQTVPIAVTAVSGNQLAALGIIDTHELSAAVPGLIVGVTSTSSSTYLRGVGQSTGTAGAEAAISTYLDGIYLAAPAQGLFDFTNVQQVAVLRGPQGTLFGRNSTGGLIQVTTKDPSFTTAESHFEAGYGNLGTVSGSAYISGPLTENLAGSLSFTGHNSDQGYIRNTYDGRELGREDSLASQAKLLWDIDSKTRATVDLFSTKYSGTEGIVAAVYPGTLANDGVTVGTNARVIDSRIDPYQDSTDYIESVKIEHDFGWGSISDQLSNTDFYNFYHFNQNGTAGRPNPNNNPVSIFDNISHIDNLANEFQIKSPDNQNFKWVAGAFYFHNTTAINLNIFSDSTFAENINTRVATSSYAGFGEVTYSVLPDTRVTAGVRYTSDTHEYSGANSLGQTPETFGLPTRLSYSRPTWRLAIDHDIVENLLAYASYNRGFKSGNFNNTSFTAPPFGPETVDAYEIGIKSEFLDHRVRLNNSVFYYDYSGVQLKANIPPSNVAFTYNAADSEIYGLDTDFSIAATGAFTINGGFEYLHARYISLPAGIRFVPNPVTSIPAGCVGDATNAKVGGVTSLTSCNLSGDTMVRSPTLTANLGFQYKTRVPWGDLTLNVADSYMGRFYFEPDDNAIQQPPYQWVTASAKLDLPRNFSVALWGVNLANAKVYDSGQSGANYTYFIGKPMTYGVTFGVSF
jgi:iron complex outermembrane receptor protein